MLLDRRRLTVYPRIVIALYLALGGWWLWSGPGLLDRGGKPIGADFVTFYAASALAGRGEAPAAWDLVRITAVEREVIGAPIPPFAFHYPPTFLFALLPLATMPYVPALVAWWIGTSAAFVTVLRRIAPHPLTIALALAFPGFFQNVIQGQNGCFTAALLGAGLLLLDRRPLLGGLAFGLLSYKPHLAPLVVVALVAGRRWSALAATVATATLFAAASWLTLGAAAWQAFLVNVPFATTMLETEGALLWTRMPSVEVAALMLGASLGVARTLQTAASAAAVVAVAVAWRRSSPLAARATVLACAAVLATPFVFDYDLAVLAVPVAFLGWAGTRTAFRRGEIPLLALAWFAPLAAPAFAAATRVQIAPLLLGALIVAAMRRARPDPAEVLT